MDSIGVYLNKGEKAIIIFLRVWSGVTSYLAVYPALLALLSLSMWASLRLQRRSSIWASYIITSMGIVVTAIAWGVLAAVMRDRAADSFPWLCACLAVSIAMFLL